MKIFSLKTTGGKVVSISIAILLCVLALAAYFIISVRYYDFKLLFANYTPTDQVVTKDKLLHDIDIMKAKEGVRFQILLFPNDTNQKFLQDEVFYNSDGSRKEGIFIHAAGGNRVFVDSKKPVEIRFIMRIMLYLKERKLDSNVGNIIGIAGGFSRDALQFPDGEAAQLFKMSVEEFNNLYKDANVSTLDTEKQIDILTDMWIKKTGYWRRGLFGIEEKPAS